MCVALRISYAPHALCIRGAGPPAVGPGGVSAALGISRTLPCIAKDAGRPESNFSRAREARCGRLMKYKLPTPEGARPSAQRRDAPMSSAPG